MGRNRIGVIVFCAGTVVGGLLSSIAPASAAGPTIVVSPDTGLANKQIVTVKVTGLEATSPYDIAECQLAVNHANPANPIAGCADKSTGGYSNTSGKLVVPLTVYTGQLGSDPGSVCTKATNGDCGIILAGHGFGQVLATAKITFGSSTIAAKTKSTATKSTVPAHKAFAIDGRAIAAGAGVNGLTVSIYDRTTSSASWKQVKGSAMKTKSIKGKPGSYAFALKGLGHPEQYQVRHPVQKLAGTTYRAFAGNTVTIKP